MHFLGKVSRNPRWRPVIVREKVVRCGVGARVLAVRLHLDADPGHWLAWRHERRRVPGGEARLGVGRWGGAGDLQVQSDAGEQWRNLILLRFHVIPPITSSLYITSFVMQIILSLCVKTFSTGVDSTGEPLWKPPVSVMWGYESHYCYISVSCRLQLFMFSELTSPSFDLNREPS